MSVCWDAKHGRRCLLPVYEIHALSVAVGSSLAVFLFKHQGSSCQVNTCLRFVLSVKLYKPANRERSPLFLPLPCHRLKLQVESVHTANWHLPEAHFQSMSSSCCLSRRPRQKSGNVALSPPIKLQSRNEDGVRCRITSNILSRTQASSLPASKLASK